MNTKSQSTGSRVAARNNSPNSRTPSGNNTVDLQVVSRRSPEEWAERINQHLRKSVEALIAAGRELEAAKKDLATGEWLRVLKGGLLGIREREAQRLMQVISNEALVNPTNWSHLPKAPQALCALSTVRPKILTKAISSGEINGRMTIKQAEAFRSKHRQSHRRRKLLASSASQSDDPNASNKSLAQTTEGEPDTDENFDLEGCVQRCAEFIYAEAEKCPTRFLEFLGQCIAEDLRSLKSLPQFQAGLAGSE